MNKVLTFILLLVSTFIFAQGKEKDKALEKSNDFVYEGNTLFNDDFVSAEKEYRKAISEVQTNAVGAYNLGNAYYRTGYYDEALLRHLEAVKNAITKDEKHKAYHNIGNVLMQQKSCKEAVEAFKNALRNNPTDEESRYNLALAKECAKQQGGGSGDEKGDDEKKEGDDEQEKKDGDKDNEDEKNKDEGENKEDQNSEGDDQQDQKDGNDKDDENGKPKDEGKNDGNPNQKPQPKQPQPGKLSPQQVKNLLEAMNNQEKKVQDKINAKKTKGVKVKTEKDW
ncbi:aerotolerance regulator BatC [Flavobacteriaceae bacterium AU392]|nr:aerotolerance regulator BatC [Flavobacteriaceae bacterium]RKM84711.1 aerotolerance regulator BatC [Flavobacteriaceae bacterium AU392]